MYLQVQFVLDASFKLDDLLKLELHKFADEVGEIVDCAQKEEKVEQGLAKLKVIVVCMCAFSLHVQLAVSSGSWEMRESLVMLVSCNSLVSFGLSCNLETVLGVRQSHFVSCGYQLCGMLLQRIHSHLM